ncbi:hypothetical protein RZN22_13245 [Bacillaceae bacterium S4-13-58]
MNYSTKLTIEDPFKLSTYSSFEDEQVINYSIGKNKSEVFLEWSDVPDAIKYEVYLGGKLLEETNFSKFTHNLNGEKSGVYRVLVYLPNTDEIPVKPIFSRKSLLFKTSSTTDLSPDSVLFLLIKAFSAKTNDDE